VNLMPFDVRADFVKVTATRIGSSHGTDEESDITL